MLCGKPPGCVAEPANEATDMNDVSNRYGRTPEELNEARARIEDARKRADLGLIRDDSEWGQRKLEEEKRKLAAQ